MPPKKNKRTKENKISSLLTEAYFLKRIDAELLLAAVLKKDRVFILAHPELVVSLADTKKFKSLIKKRLAGWSTAVLLGYKEFYGLEFKVDKNVLVPRPETEIMVDSVLEYIKDKSNSLILDIGTGSGAIIISLFKNLPVEKNNNFYASDKSHKALAIARYNAKKHQAKINFLSGDLLLPYLPLISRLKPDNLIIAANLPYLTPSEMKEESLKKEPKSALLSGPDGLWHYTRLFLQLKKVTATKIFLICEINPAQALSIKKLALASLSDAKTSFINDYTKRPRFFVLEI